MAALKYTSDERLELADAARFARIEIPVAFWCLPGSAGRHHCARRSRWRMLGVVMKVNLGVVLSGLIWFVVVAFSFMMVLLLIGLIIGWPLMWGAIACEGTDAFDAVSRAYAYAYQRPFRYLSYIALGGIGWRARLDGRLGSVGGNDQPRRLECITGSWPGPNCRDHVTRRTRGARGVCPSAGA